MRWYPVCPVLIRSTFGSHPVDTRSRQVESGAQRTTNGHVTVKTVWNGRGPFAKRTGNVQVTNISSVSCDRTKYLNLTLHEKTRLICHNIRTKRNQISNLIELLRVCFGIIFQRYFSFTLSLMQRKLLQFTAFMCKLY